MLAPLEIGAFREDGVGGSVLDDDEGGIGRLLEDIGRLAEGGDAERLIPIDGEGSGSAASFICFLGLPNSHWLTLEANLREHKDSK